MLLQLFLLMVLLLFAVYEQSISTRHFKGRSGVVRLFRRASGVGAECICVPSYRVASDTKDGRIRSPRHNKCLSSRADLSIGSVDA